MPGGYFYGYDDENDYRDRPPMGPRYHTDGNTRLQANFSIRENSRDRRGDRRDCSPAPPPVNIYNYNVDENNGYRRPGQIPVQVPFVPIGMPGTFPAATGVPTANRPTEINLRVEQPTRERSRSRGGRRHRSRSRSQSSSRSRSRSRDRRYDRDRYERERLERKYREDTDRERRLREDAMLSERERHRREGEDRLRRDRDKDVRDTRDRYLTKQEYEYELLKRELDSLRKRMRDDERDKDKKDKDAQKKSGYMTKEDCELERTRKELAAFKLQQQKEEEKRLLKKEMELKRLEEEKKKEEEAARKKRAAEDAVKEFQAMEEKKRKEMEEKEREYQQRLREDLKKSGLNDEAIEKVLKNEKICVEKPVEKKRPTYTRMARRYLSFETLHTFKLDYTMDQDPDYILIKRWVPEDEQDRLWEHTKEIRARRERHLTQNTVTTTVLQIEDSKHRTRLSGDVQYEFVKKRDKKRDKSPAPGLITFLAGGKR